MLVSDASVAFGHAILTTPEFLARLPGAMPA
jgi:hypothetical protein